MTDPKPLSATELANMRTQFGRYPTLFPFKELFDHIDAQAATIRDLRAALDKLEVFCSEKYEKVPTQTPETIAAFGESFLKGFEFGIDTIKGYLFFHVLGHEGKTLEQIKAEQARDALAAAGGGQPGAEFCSCNDPAVLGHHSLCAAQTPSGGALLCERCGART